MLNLSVCSNYWIYSLGAQRFALPALGQGRRSRPTGKMIRRVKLLGICAESPASGARFVRRFVLCKTTRRIAVAQSYCMLEYPIFDIRYTIALLQIFRRFGLSCVEVNFQPHHRYILIYLPPRNSTED